jgi:hypothetical protein
MFASCCVYNYKECVFYRQRNVIFTELKTASQNVSYTYVRDFNEQYN